ncbi:MAG: tRNA (N(6)-L-threonylcarbamoyladenosine(37)-C(2))-methylthiotransferase MtaB [Gammaproteobacteria bacterium]|nr:tRNA (N(6)-L-threonylcarbamoyladenosine(37)-C(2))-methylthiotransferase MtaB [Gammaproteobacteria bacterium]
MTAHSFATTTLGCKVNLFESGLIGHSLQNLDWRQVNPTDHADLYIINTCTVTHQADRQARQTVRRLIRQNPQSLIVVTGCYAQISPEACANIPGVDLVLGNDRKLDFHDLLPDLLQGKLPPVLVGDVNEYVSLPESIIETCDGHTRAFVQVQQGCNQGCTFCVIHTARGPSRSFPIMLIRRQIERLVLNGYREIVLCGVDIGSYGNELESDEKYHNLATLLREVCSISGDFRLRISSIDPSYLDAELIGVLAEEEKICPHFHLSLQSGNTLILKRMKRRYTAELMNERVARLSERIPHAVYGADIMTGFPTESEQAFEDSIAMIERLNIAFPHVFSYSDRPGVPAARIPRQVPHDIRKKRTRILIETGEKVREKLFLGVLKKQHRVSVLIEKLEKDPRQRAFGRSAEYLPVLVQGGSLAPGDLVNAQITGIDGTRLIARPASDR